jgi:hypothetical protein
MQKISSDFHPIPHQLLRQLRCNLGAGGSKFVLVALGLLLLPILIPLGLLFGLSYLAWGYRYPSFVMDVWEEDNSLIVERSGERESIPLAHISSLLYVGRTNPPHVIVTLASLDPFGTQIQFIPDLSRGRQAARQLVERLNKRTQPPRVVP